MTDYGMPSWDHFQPWFLETMVLKWSLVTTKSSPASIEDALELNNTKRKWMEAPSCSGLETRSIKDRQRRNFRSKDIDEQQSVSHRRHSSGY